MTLEDKIQGKKLEEKANVGTDSTTIQYARTPNKQKSYLKRAILIGAGFATLASYVVYELYKINESLNHMDLSNLDLGF